MAERAVVSWAGPVQRARTALDTASEQLERKNIAQGMLDLHECQRQVSIAMQFIRGEEERTRREISLPTPFIDEGPPA